MIVVRDAPPETHNLTVRHGITTLVLTYFKYMLDASLPASSQFILPIVIHHPPSTLDLTTRGQVLFLVRLRRQEESARHALPAMWT